MKNNMPPRKEYSAGGVVYKKLWAEGNAPSSKTASRQSEQRVVWLLGKHSGYHKWVLPKGMIEAEETPEEAAVRETEEELMVKARIVQPEPVHVEKYTYMAEPKKLPVSAKATAGKQADTKEPVRRVQTYQENKDFVQVQNKVKIDKSVTFYLMEYVSGDPADHGWEMEAAGWFEYGEALKLLAFEGEKHALSKAHTLFEILYKSQT